MGGVGGREGTVGGWEGGIMGVRKEGDRGGMGSKETGEGVKGRV